MSTQRSLSEQATITDPQTRRVIAWVALGLAVVALAFAGLTLLLRTERTVFSTIATFAPVLVCLVVSATSFRGTHRRNEAPQPVLAGDDPAARRTGAPSPGA